MVSITDFTIFHDPDPSVYCEQMTAYLNFCFDICCPVETINIRADRFSSPLLKQLRRKKEGAYKNKLRDEVKVLTQLIKTEIHRLNKIYVETLLGNKTCREMWNALKQLCNTSSKSCSLDVDLEKLNQEFVGSPNTPTVFIAAGDCPNTYNTVCDDVYKMLTQIKTRKACGPDLLSPVLLKECADIVSEPITVLFNQCLSLKEIPDCWRVARITPVPKKGTARTRPIACTSVLLKLFEKMLLTRIAPVLPGSDPLQFAYRQSRSTLDAVAYLVHAVASALDRKAKAVRLLFLDYTNAFGSVDRGILLQQIADGGVDPCLVKLLQDYFTNRSQFTCFNGQVSSPLPTYAGLPQGAILSPFLFNLYKRDLPIFDPLFCCKYADDIVIGCE
jgi:hypothetical protein